MDDITQIKKRGRPRKNAVVKKHTTHEKKEEDEIILHIKICTDSDEDSDSESNSDSSSDSESITKTNFFTETSHINNSESEKSSCSSKSMKIEDVYKELKKKRNIN